MFLSRGYRDLGIAFQTHPGSQGSFRVEVKNSVLLSSRDGYLLKPTEWPKGSQASCGVWREDSGWLSWPCRKRRPASLDVERLSDPPSGSSQCTSPKHPISNWTGDLFLIWYYTCFNAILPNHPTLALSHRVQKTVLYICVSFAVSHKGLSLPSF